MNGFIIGRIKSLKYATRGCLLLIKTEHSIMAQVCICAIVIVLGFYFDISGQDWINQSIIMALVLGVESLNTAVEKLADFIHPDHHSKIGFIKDIAAGAVTFTAITAFLVFSIIYSPYFF